MDITLKNPQNDQDHRIGPLSAPIVIVEYGDFQSVDCIRALNVMDELINEFKNQICYIWRHFPDKDAHPDSYVAAVAAEAAGIQGKFWEMHRALLHNKNKLSTSLLVEMAKKIGLNTFTFLKDLENDDCLKAIEIDIKAAHANGINQTPTLYLNGIAVDPTTTFPVLRREILDLLHEESLR